MTVMDREIEIEAERGSATQARCLDFVVRHGARAVPATLWNGGPSRKNAPLVMLQHGGPFHKRHERTDELAQTVMNHTGAAVLLIDGPIHGRRRTDSPGLEQMLAELENHWRSDPGIAAMVADWRLALDAVVDAGWADARRVVWLGPSMGTAYGIPVCAAEPRIKAAAFGMWGLEWGQKAALQRHAAGVRATVLFQIKQADEIFAVPGQRRLFDALGSGDKCLRTYPGGHSLTGPGQIEDLLRFLSGALASSDESGAPDTAPTVSGSSR